MVKSEEYVSDQGESHEEQSKPFCYAENTLCFKVDKEIGIDEGGGAVGDQNGRVEAENCRLSVDKYSVYYGEEHSGKGIEPLHLASFVEEEPIGNVQNGENNVEEKASYAPVKLRITSFGTCKEYVEYYEGEKNDDKSDKLQNGGYGNVAVLFFLYGLDKSCNHNAKAEEIAEVCEVDVKVPTDKGDVVKDSKARNAADKSERAVYGLENELRGSVFDHG